MTHPFEDYRLEMRPLSAEEGGGYLVSLPDLPGCIADGESQGEALAGAREAFEAWIEAAQADGRDVPAPNSEGKPAKFVLRLPRTQHQDLTLAAGAEGVSVNTLVSVFIAEGLTRRERPGRAPQVPVQRSSADIPVSEREAEWRGPSAQAMAVFTEQFFVLPHQGSARAAPEAGTSSAQSNVVSLSVRGRRRRAKG